jgi:glycosyltransferase involved in cell wall biosynthesis
MAFSNQPAHGNLVSLVVPVFNEAEVLGTFYQRATGALSALDGMTYEILFVDDGSRDSSYQQLAKLAAEDPRI